MPSERARPLVAFAAVSVLCALVILLNLAERPEATVNAVEAAQIVGVGPQVEFGAVLRPRPPEERPAGNALSRALQQPVASTVGSASDSEAVLTSPTTAGRTAAGAEEHVQRRRGSNAATSRRAARHVASAHRHRLPALLGRRGHLPQSRTHHRTPSRLRSFVMPGHSASGRGHAHDLRPRKPPHGRHGLSVRAHQDRSVHPQAFRQRGRGVIQSHASSHARGHSRGHARGHAHGPGHGHGHSGHRGHR